MIRYASNGFCTIALFGVLLVGCTEPSAGPPDELPTAATEQACLALADLALPDTEVTAATLFPGGEFRPTPDANPADLPSFCRVVGVAEPAVNFEVWLPMTEWNGRFLGVGNGGMAGRISYGSMATALNDGYATASTDTGHRASGVPFDASWAMGRPDLVEDFGHRALHLTTENAKAVVDALYGTPPAYSYYVGCSKGGQQGMMEAQRYPEDYDGLLVGNPAADWTRFYAGAHLGYAMATLAEPGSWLSPEKVASLGDAVDRACDRIDGVADGVLQDPRACDFDPATIACPAGQDDPTCLTPPQVAAVRQIWAGATDSSGELIFPGLVPGGEAAPGGWERWVTGREPFTSLHYFAGESFFRYFVFEDPDWDFRSFDFDSDLAYALQKVGPALDANDPDLAPLRDRGGKLLVTHGWSDADISPLSSIHYYERVLEELWEGREREQALAEIQDFFRLFLVPGLGHCRGGPGATEFDALSPLIEWVEGGVAPATIPATREVDGDVIHSRPLCPYPEVAVWDGSGDPALSESYACVIPTG